MIQFIDFAQCSQGWFSLCYCLHICSSTSYHSTLFSYYYMWNDFLLFFMLFLFVTNFLFQFLLHWPIFFLIILLECKFLPVDDVFNSFSYPGFVIGEHFCSFLYTEIIYLHTDSVSSFILLDKLTKTSQWVQSKDPLSFSTVSSNHSFIVQVTVGSLCSKGIYLGISWTMLWSGYTSVYVFNICVALVKYTIFLCSTFYVLKIVHDWVFKWTVIILNALGQKFQGQGRGLYCDYLDPQSFVFFFFFCQAHRWGAFYSYSMHPSNNCAFAHQFNLLAWLYPHYIHRTWRYYRIHKFHAYT